MRRLAFSLSLPACLLALAFLGAGCGGGDDDGAGSCQFSNFNPDDTACFTCMQDSCDGELSACYGGSWETDPSNGPCGPTVDCICNCATGDQTCFLGCAAGATAECQTCGTAVGDCQDANCMAECS